MQLPTLLVARCLTPMGRPPTLSDRQKVPYAPRTLPRNLTLTHRMPAPSIRVPTALAKLGAVTTVTLLFDTRPTMPIFVARRLVGILKTNGAPRRNSPRWCATHRLLTLRVKNLSAGINGACVPPPHTKILPEPPMLKCYLPTLQDAYPPGWQHMPQLEPTMVRASKNMLGPSRGKVTAVHLQHSRPHLRNYVSYAPGRPSYPKCDSVTPSTREQVTQHVRAPSRRDRRYIGSFPLLRVVWAGGYPRACPCFTQYSPPVSRHLW